MVLEHKYLFANLFGLLPLTMALFLAGRLRNTALICGAILCLYSPPVARLYERVYWTPGHLFGGAWGVEDVMFCFHAGVMSWLCAVMPWRNGAYAHPIVSVVIKRLLLVSFFAVVLLILMLVAGYTVFIAFLLTQTVSTALIIAIRPGYLRLAVPGALLFSVYYFSLLGLWRFFMPGFMDMWNGSQLTGTQLFGVPAEEYLWVLSFCTGFPITMAFAFDMRIGLHSLALGEKAADAH